MTAINNIFLSASLVFCGLLQAQEQFEVNLNIRAIDDRFGRSMMVAPCFYYSNRPEEFRSFAAGDELLKKTEIRLPENFGVFKDTAYGYFYYSGAENPFASGYIMFVLGNNRRLELPHALWIDRNNNLDFTDDGPPDTSVYYRRFVDVAIPGLKPGQGTYMVRLSRFPVDSFFSFKNMVNTYFGAARGNKRFADANHSFREQRLNILAADVRVQIPNGQRDSFRIGLKDANCNGYFHEPGIDELMIGPFGQILTAEKAQIIAENKGQMIEWELQRYQITSIATDGSVLKFHRINNAQLDNSLKPGKKIPSFKFRTTAELKHKQRIRSLRGKPLYIYIWNSNKTLFKQDSASINLLIAKHPEIRVLCLNYGDSPKWVAKFNQYYNTQWNMGFSSSEINDKLKLQYIPWGIFLDKKQKVLLPLIQPGGLIEYMSNISH